MATYCITFRIANRTVGGSTYDDRRSQLIENVRDNQVMGFWDGTTSFFFAESNDNTMSYARKLIFGLSAQHDMLVMFDPSDMSGAYFGAVPEEAILASFLPFAKKLP